MSETTPKSAPPTNQPDVSVIAPCFNEVGNVEALYREIAAALDSTSWTYEVLFVDDFSTDGTREKLLTMQATCLRLRPLFHHRNFGQSASVRSGFESAQGRFVVTLDGDLQNDPADIPLLLDHLDKADFVNGIRANRRDSTMKRLSSRIANAVRGTLLGDSIQDAGCGFRAMRIEVTDSVPGFRALHRFLPTIVQWHGFRVVQVPVNHRPRVAGVSKYGVGNRLWVGIIDILAMMWYRKRMFPPHRLMPSAGEAEPRA